MTDEMRDGGTAEYSDPLQKVAAYRLAMVMVDAVRRDAEGMKKDAMLREVAGQLLRAAGSVLANIAEGYARTSVAERRRFYEYALGSAREVEAWYHTAARHPSSSLISHLTSIRRLLLTMMRNARENAARTRR